MKFFQGTAQDVFITGSKFMGFDPDGVGSIPGEGFDPDNMQPNARSILDHVTILETGSADTTYYGQGNNHALYNCLLNKAPSSTATLTVLDNTRYTLTAGELNSSGAYPSGNLSYKILKDAGVGMLSSGSTDGFRA